jgi:nitrogen fixation protein FixH
MNILAKGKFTGWHMTTILVAFFGVVIAVNFFMARMAVGTFGGTVVDNSYVASQNYNRWLAAADRQDRLCWTVKASLTDDRHVALQVQDSGRTLAGATAVGDARHPLGRAEDIDLNFAAMPDGRLLSTETLPVGRWNVQISVRRGPHIFKLTEPLQ